VKNISSFAQHGDPNKCLEVDEANSMTPGRFVAVVGDGEYIIYTALALRNQSFGQGLDFVW
jgi:hypothetical protein